MTEGIRERAEKLLESLNQDKAVTDIFADSFERQYLIYGQTPKAWQKHFRIYLTENPDAAQCKSLASKLIVLIQEAMFYLGAAEALVDALNAGGDKEYTNEFNRLIAEYREAGKSTPAAKTLDMMAANKVIDIRGAIENGKIIKNFWKRIVDGLVEVRKNLEIATWNTNTQVRQELYGGGGNVPNTPEKESYGADAKAIAAEKW